MVLFACSRKLSLWSLRGVSGPSHLHLDLGSNLHPHPRHRAGSHRGLPGVQVTDAEGMREQGISPSEVAQIVSKTFNDMIFIHGHVHCDPHSANLLVCKDKHGKVIPTASGGSVLDETGQGVGCLQIHACWAA